MDSDKLAEAAGGVKTEEVVLQTEATVGVQQGESTIPLPQLVQQLLRSVETVYENRRS